MHIFNAVKMLVVRIRVIYRVSQKYIYNLLANFFQIKADMLKHCCFGYLKLTNFQNVYH
jgi:hypothetical protein